jgi:K(+)-stimulated pyrophosphate-energized sodium pump
LKVIDFNPDKGDLYMSLGTELLWVVPASIVLALALAFFLIRDVLRRDSGTKEMIAVSDTIYVGAIAFLRRQYTTIAVLAD